MKVIYNTVDGAMWFIYAIQEYYRKTDDRDFVVEMLPVMRNILDAYQRGTSFERHET